jgi:hypothetical protein
VPAQTADATLGDTLRAANHSSHVCICVDELDVYTWVTAHEHAKDFICERLSYLINVMEVEDNGAKPVDA